MDHSTEKSVVAQTDSIENASSEGSNVLAGDAEEIIIQHLEHTGEEVGLTPRSVLAAVVSLK
jgi:hypothetical protein